MRVSSRGTPSRPRSRARARRDITAPTAGSAAFTYSASGRQPAFRAASSASPARTEGAHPCRRRVLGRRCSSSGSDISIACRRSRKHRLDRRLPSLLDADLLPQPRLRRELVAVDPILDLAVFLDLALDLLAAWRASLEGGELALQRLKRCRSPVRRRSSTRRRAASSCARSASCRESSPRLCPSSSAQARHRLAVGRAPARPARRAASRRAAPATAASCWRARGAPA